MILVYIPGVFDLLHIGHVSILERARSLGDKLIVGVPSDDVVVEDKGKLPIIKLQHRLRMLSSLRCVDVAVPYPKLEFITHLCMFKPDILAVGDTWGCWQRHLDAERWVEEHGKRMVRLPYSKEISTTEIIDRITNRSK